jgi:hypothetical protein
VRLATNLAHAARHAKRAGMLRGLARHLPVLAIGYGASLAGEAAAYATRLLGGRRDLVRIDRSAASAADAAQ